VCSHICRDGDLLKEAKTEELIMLFGRSEFGGDVVRIGSTQLVRHWQVLWECRERSNGVDRLGSVRDRQSYQAGDDGPAAITAGETLQLLEDFQAQQLGSQTMPTNIQAKPARLDSTDAPASRTKTAALVRTPFSKLNQQLKASIEVISHPKAVELVPRLLGRSKCHRSWIQLVPLRTFTSVDISSSTQDNRCFPNLRRLRSYNQATLSKQGKMDPSYLLVTMHTSCRERVDASS